jgi:predicted MFS family arabinose efflux permease
MINLAKVVGPAVAGVCYPLVGPAWCFALNALTFVAVIVALFMMRLKPIITKARTTAALDDLKEGIRYVLSDQVIRTLIGMTAIISVLGLSYMTLIPAWAVNILQGDATTNGWLLSARGLGALCGALMIASLGRVNRKGAILTLGNFVFPVMLLFFALARWLPLSMLALVGVGWGSMVLFNMVNTLIQTLVPDELRGRAVSVYMLSFFGLMPVGALLAGAVAEAIGEPLTVIISAIISISFAVFLWVRVPNLRKL